MSEASPRFALPLLQAGQAQKEIVHSEALIAIDMLLHAAVQGVADIPPVAPAAGQCWIVGAAGSGAWAGRAGSIACWSGGGWRFAVPAEGTTAWMVAAGVPARFSGGGWRLGTVAASAIKIDGVQVVGPQQPSIAVPGGGITVDAEARAALTSVIVALKTHGLISV